MATVKHHKVVAALPAVLEANAIYYVRAGQGHDVYVTNSSGVIVGYPSNAQIGLAELDPSGLPAIRPTLNLDFINCRFVDPRVTFTRASGGGIFNAQGNFEWLPANTPRIDYDPVTGECLGLLIEEQRTNLLTWSSDFSSWIKSGAPVVLDGGVLSPDGQSPMTLLQRTSNLGTYIQKNTAKPGQPAPYTFSVFIKTGTSKFASIRLQGAYPSRVDACFDLLKGTISFVTVAGGFSEPNGAIEQIGDGLFRCSVSAISDSSGLISSFLSCSEKAQQVDASDISGTSGIYIWGAQLEAGAYPTSYIPTTSAQVARAAGLATVNDLSPWYNHAQGTWIVEAAGVPGEPLLTAGNAVIVADTVEVKTYKLSYTEDQAATSVVIGKGHIRSVRYYPRAAA